MAGPLSGQPMIRKLQERYNLTVRDDAAGRIGERHYSRILEKEMPSHCFDI
jgi:hypothetical protein